VIQLNSDLNQEGLDEALEHMDVILFHDRPEVLLELTTCLQDS
jgi:hypothetical protein